MRYVVNLCILKCFNGQIYQKVLMNSPLYVNTLTSPEIKRFVSFEMFTLTEIYVRFFIYD